MSKDKIIYQNKWCKLILRGTVYVLKSKGEKYNDQYFTSLEAALKAIGLNPQTFFINHTPEQ